jgi:hypothetical protein
MTLRGCKTPIEKMVADVKRFGYIPFGYDNTSKK